MTAMFVNLPVTDLERAKAFYTAIGFTINPAFTDHNAACIVVEEDHSYFMILVREYFQTFTDLPPEAPFYDFVERAVAQGILSGYGCGDAGEPCPGNYFRPGNPATRGQLAKVLYLAVQQP